MAPVEKERAEPVTQAQHKNVVEAIDRIEDKLSIMAERLRYHYEEEHKDFNEALKQVSELTDWIKGGKFAARIVIKFAAFLAAMAGAFTWIKANFTILPK